jgi:hypothetical protein
MIEAENYNETVLIPILQDKINTLMTQGILLEAKLQIAEKEKAALQNKLDALTAPPVAETAE